MKELDPIGEGGQVPAAPPGSANEEGVQISDQPPLQPLFPSLILDGGVWISDPRPQQMNKLDNRIKSLHTGHWGVWVPPDASWISDTARGS